MFRSRTVPSAAHKDVRYTRGCVGLSAVSFAAFVKRIGRNSRASESALHQGPTPAPLSMGFPCTNGNLCGKDSWSLTIRFCA